MNDSDKCVQLFMSRFRVQQKTTGTNCEPFASITQFEPKRSECSEFYVLRSMDDFEGRKYH